MAQKKSAPFDSTIPVRGRKLIEVAIICYPIRTIPVRGRKHAAKNDSQPVVSTIPVRGQKNSASKDAEFFFCKP